MPADLSPGPHRDALELANQAKFSQEELNAYERVRDEIRQVIEIAKWLVVALSASSAKDVIDSI